MERGRRRKQSRRRRMRRRGRRKVRREIRTRRKRKEVILKGIPMKAMVYIIIIIMYIPVIIPFLQCPLWSRL